MNTLLLTDAASTSLSRRLKGRLDSSTGRGESEVALGDPKAAVSRQHWRGEGEGELALRDPKARVGVIFQDSGLADSCGCAAPACGPRLAYKVASLTQADADGLIAQRLDVFE